MNLNPPKSIANISFILSSEYPQGKNNASPRDMATNDDVVVEERYLILGTPCHRVPTKFVSKDVKIQQGECSFSIMCDPIPVQRETGGKLKQRKSLNGYLFHGSFGLLYVLAGKSKALFGSCPLRLSSKKNEEHTKIL